MTFCDVVSPATFDTRPGSSLVELRMKARRVGKARNRKTSSEISMPNTDSEAPNQSRLKSGHPISDSPTYLARHPQQGTSTVGLVRSLTHTPKLMGAMFSQYGIRVTEPLSSVGAEDLAESLYPVFAGDAEGCPLSIGASIGAGARACLHGQWIGLGVTDWAPGGGDSDCQSPQLPWQ